LLNDKTGPAGVYDIDVPREWVAKAAPWILAVSVVVRSLLPVSMAAIKLDASDQQWANIGEQLELAAKTLASLAGAADPVTPAGDEADPTHTATTSAPTSRPEGGLLVDASILLYVVDRASPFHERAAGWLTEMFNGLRRVSLPWESLAAFVRISTHPRASSAPL
jgi:hypothetical protein